MWHWEYPNGALVYTDGCWAPTDDRDPVPVVRFDYDVDWLGADGKVVTYGEHGEHGEGVAGRLILYNSLYALLYSAMAISGAVLIFQRRNLK